MSRRDELAERVLCAMIAASYGEEGYVPALKDEDFVEDPNGEWGKEGGDWSWVGRSIILPTATKRYSMVTTYQRRMARDAILQADEMLRVESESSGSPQTSNCDKALVDALRDIARGPDCGCMPCTGACMSSDATELRDTYREIAQKALATIPGGGA